MKKLLKLLNNYEQTVVKKSYMYPVYHYDEDKNIILNLYIGFNTEDDIKYQWLLSYIISARYGFIKWLVDNEKIDRDKLEKKVLKEDLIRKFDEGLIMLLSISDHPIEDLCKLLK